MDPGSEKRMNPFVLQGTFFERFTNPSDCALARQISKSFAAKTEDELVTESLLDNRQFSLLFSILSLQEFYRQNWVGPREPFTSRIFDLATTAFPSREEALEFLVSDGEFPYRMTRKPELLAFALKELQKGDLSRDSLRAWWLCRALYLHLRLLDAPCYSLRARLVILVNEHADVSKTAFALEAANFMHECEDSSSLSYLGAAATAEGMKFELTGRLGRRTIHQTFDVHQLTVSINSAKEGHSPSLEQAVAPKNVALNDDQLRENVEFTDNQVSVKATHAHLAIFLGHVRELWRFHARDSEITDKITAFTEKVLEAPNSWQIFSAGLFWRSRLETDKTRTMERACFQFKALAEQIDDASTESRFDWSFAVWFPTDWECDREQAMLFAGLGAFKTALELFSRREMHEEAVQCLLSLGKLEEAESLVHSQLQKYPDDAKLICVLGDIKRRAWESLLASTDQNDPAVTEAFHEAESIYQKSWKLSSGRLAKAQRNLGALYYVIGNYQNVIEALNAAVALNPLFESSWFLIGFSHLQLKDYEQALRAFTRVITLNGDGPDAWTHIAHCHVQLGRLDDAYRALLQLTRINFNQTECWLSLFSVALAVGEPRDAIKSVRRVVEILSIDGSSSFTPKETGKIVEMCTQLVDLIGKVCSDPAFNDLTVPVKRQFDSLLFDYLTQTALASNSEFWLHVVARYLRGDRWPLHATQVREALLKSYRCLQSRPFDKDPATFKLITQIINQLKELDTERVEEVDLIVKSVKRKCRDVFESTPEYLSI